MRDRKPTDDKETNLILPSAENKRSHHGLSSLNTLFSEQLFRVAFDFEDVPQRVQLVIAELIRKDEVHNRLWSHINQA